MLRRLLARRKPEGLEVRQAPKSDLDWRGFLRAGFGGLASVAGPQVNESTALGLSTVYACVRVLSESIAQLPLVLYTRDGRKRERAIEHPLYAILHDLPNPEITSFELREFMAASLLLRGNALAWVERDRGGRVRGLWPLRWDWITVERAPSGELLYIWSPPNGAERRFLAGDLWRVRGLGFDNVQGASPIAVAREAVGFGIAVSEFGSRFFSNGAVIAGTLETPSKLDDASYRRLKESLSEFRGLSQAHKTLILEEGMKWQKMGVPPEEAQFLETRKFSRAEIAGIFRVPPHMIGDLERATFSNIEHQAIEFVVHSLGPWLERIEQSVSRDLLLAGERSRFYAEHLVDGLLRGDTQARFTAYGAGINAGWLTRNEVRERENLNPIEGLDEPLTPLNVVAGPLPPDPDPNRAPPNLRALLEQHGRSVLRGVRLLEASELRGRASRRRLAERFRPFFVEAAERAFRAERREVMKLEADHLGEARSLDTFRLRLGELYGEEGDLRALFGRLFDRPFRTLAAAAWEDAAGEVDADFDAERAEAWAGAILAAYVASHAGISEAAILERAARPEARGELEALFAEWNETRALAIAKSETTFTSRGAARQAWKGAGRGARWVTSDPCPLCAPFSGRAVGVDASFAAEGETIQGEGTQPLRLGKSIKNPPLHKGCECDIAPA